jgi:hypothetical protein
MRATFAVAVAGVAVLAATACSRQGDENLGMQAKPAAWAVDVAQLTKPSELVHAASMPAPELDKKLGAHRFEASSTTKIEPPGKPVETMDEGYALDADGQGNFRVLHANSHGYGFEAESFGGELYVRPRYGKYVKRKPEGDEADRLRASVETLAPEYLKLFERWISVREDGRAQVLGRPAVKLKLAATSSPSAVVADGDPSKKWRESMSVRYIDGDVLIDAGTGALVGIKLDAAYTFTREEGGKKTGPFAVTLAYRQTAAAPEQLTAPTDAIDSPHRIRPMLDRSELLEGLK